MTQKDLAERCREQLPAENIDDDSQQVSIPTRPAQDISRTSSDLKPAKSLLLHNAAEYRSLEQRFGRSPNRPGTPWDLRQPEEVGRSTRSSVLKLIKFSMRDCPACESMAAFDSTVAAEQGLTFIDVDMRDPGSYRPYRLTLLHRHPLKSELQLPAYLLAEDVEGDCIVHAELNGAMPKKDFQSAIEILLDRAQSLTPRTLESS